MNRTEPKAKRTYSALSSPAVKQELDRLLNEPSFAQYRDAMTKLGNYLGVIAKTHLGQRKPFALVTTPEDADFLTRGMLATLPRSQARLACYWTTRHQFQGREDVATVTQSFVDPSMPKKVETVVIAKSIIASGCIVRTNLEKFLKAAEPRRIVIAAPVMLVGAEAQLRAAFPTSISNRFEFLTFATDAVRDGNTVRPGVGGQVEERLGLKGKSERFSPTLVKEWRASQQTAVLA